MASTEPLFRDATHRQPPMQFPCDCRRSQQSTVPQARAVSTQTADNRRWISNGATPSFLSNHVSHSAHADRLSFHDSRPWTSTTRLGSNDAAFCTGVHHYGLSPVAARSKDVGLRPLTWWYCGFESRRRLKWMSHVSVVCCQVEVSATGRSLIQRSPTTCGMPECDLETSNNEGLSPARMSSHEKKERKTGATWWWDVVLRLHYPMTIRTISHPVIRPNRSPDPIAYESPSYVYNESAVHYSWIINTEWKQQAMLFSHV